MAEASRLGQWLEAYVGSGASPTQQAESLDAIISLLKKEALTMEQFVVGMEKYLTSMGHAKRSRVIGWKALRGAVVGCLALLRRKVNVGAVSKSDAKTVAESFSSNFRCSLWQSMTESFAFNYWNVCSITILRQLAAELGDDLVHGIYEAADGVKKS